MSQELGTIWFIFLNLPKIGLGEGVRNSQSQFLVATNLYSMYLERLEPLYNKEPGSLNNLPTYLLHKYIVSKILSFKQQRVQCVLIYLFETRTKKMFGFTDLRLILILIPILFIVEVCSDDKLSDQEKVAIKQVIIQYILN